MHKIGVIGEYPGYFTRGRGAEVWDIDDNVYIDYVMGKGVYILGYCDPSVDEAVQEQIRMGNLFPMGNILHTKLAETLVRLIPGAERVLFFKTGTCATSAAVRLARAFTGRNTVFSSGYHGWQDWSNRGAGIPDECSKYFFDFAYNLDRLEESLEEHAGDGAAVIVTPEVPYFCEDFYRELQGICRNAGMVFILDEVKSGFRVEVGGFQTKYGIEPDISIFSKAMSNGYSLSAVVGKEGVMETSRRLHTAGTYDVEVLPFAAALANIDVLEKTDVLRRIDENGRYLTEGLSRVSERFEIGIHPVYGGGSFRLWCRDPEMEREFYAHMAERGILFYAYDNSYISGAHTRGQIDRTVDAAAEVASVELKRYRGSYRPFTLDDIKRITNRKGFLKHYTGRSGRA